MKIVLDLQSLQGENRYRGIGRYSASLAKGIINHSQNDEIHIVLNQAITALDDDVARDFARLIGKKNIHYFNIPSPVFEANQNNLWRTRTAELVREHYIAGLSPDLVHIGSLIEGIGENHAVSIGSYSSDVPVAVTLYDLIPYLYQEQYICTPEHRQWYLRKLEHLKRADILLAISESAGNIAIDKLDISKDKITNIYADSDPQFRPIIISNSEKEIVYARYNIRKEFVLYTGGADHRKNLESLLVAYSMMPGAIRSNHQLLIVGKISEGVKAQLMRICRKRGLSDLEVVFTTYVDDGDLVKLYNLCKVFILPSLHEGFGLPLLEAMRCGAPVIGSNCSSIPEVIGFENAMFDPTSRKSISKKLHQVLTDNDFAKTLIKQGNIQAQIFSWDRSAKLTLDSFYDFLNRRKPYLKHHKISTSNKLTLAYVLPELNQFFELMESGSNFIRSLSAYYDIDIISASEQPDVNTNLNYGNKSIDYFSENFEKYQRVIYNIRCCSDLSVLLALLKVCPGTVVLHDFYLGDSFDNNGESIYSSHGYSALINNKGTNGSSELGPYPGNLQFLHSAMGVIVISHQMIHEAQRWFGSQIIQGWECLSLPIDRPKESPRKGARKTLSISNDTLLICSISSRSERQYARRLETVWKNSALADNSDCQLIILDEAELDKQDIHRKTDKEESVAVNVSILSFDNDKAKYYLAAADIAVQLQENSQSRALMGVLKWLALGVPTIVNEYPLYLGTLDNCVKKLPTEFTDQQLNQSLEELVKNHQLRKQMSTAGLNFIEKYHESNSVAKKLKKVVDSYATDHTYAKRKKLLNKIYGLEDENLFPTKKDITKTAIAISENEQAIKQGQLLIDISTLVRTNAKTGIQRVTSNVLDQLIRNTTNGYRAEPVYRKGPDYYYARNFMVEHLGLTKCRLLDSPIEVDQNDIFIGLDLDMDVKDEHWESNLRHKKRQGLKVVYIVYDILPVTIPDRFPDHVPPLYTTWLHQITEFSDGLVCISKFVADEVHKWHQAGNVKKSNLPDIGYFHLGANIADSNEDARKKNDAVNGDLSIDTEIELLMVGTIEPRKRHAQVLDAIEILWSEGYDIAITFVGKEGWKTSDLVRRIQASPQYNSRLFWLNNATDADLVKLYQSSSALVMASEAEGFGLPIIEAAKHNLPVIVRNLPVFKELADDHAFYFDGNSGSALARAIKDWRDLFLKDKHPGSQNMNILTWQECVSQLMQVIIEDDWVYRTDH